MSYLTLSEAAEYTSHKTGLEIEPAAMLRAGVYGALLITAPFSSLMRNLTDGRNDEVLGLLVIPQQHLLEIETDGQAKIIDAASLNGGTKYSPQVTRTRDQLRVLVSELDRLMPYWVTTQQTAPANDTATPALAEPVEERRARYLAWHTEEYRINPRGALQRVYEREAKQNPRADRANIGKDIKKAQGTAKTQKLATAWTSQLVQDGKRKG